MEREKSTASTSENALAEKDYKLKGITITIGCGQPLIRDLKEAMLEFEELLTPRIHVCTQ